MRSQETKTGRERANTLRARERKREKELPARAGPNPRRVRIVREVEGRKYKWDERKGCL